jgi:hypothetical protein
VARFYLDEPVGEVMIAGLAALGHDALSTRQAGNKGLSDPRQLRFAARQNRVLVTFNDADFGLLHEALSLWFPASGETVEPLHVGIALLPSSSRVDNERLIAALADLADRVEDYRNRCFRWIPASGWREVEAVAEAGNGGLT